jgi:hypothetical protein
MSRTFESQMKLSLRRTLVLTNRESSILNRKSTFLNLRFTTTGLYAAHSSERIRFGTFGNAMKYYCLYQKNLQVYF